jgi:hypothetical protein
MSTLIHARAVIIHAVAAEQPPLCGKPLDHRSSDDRAEFSLAASKHMRL